MLNFPFPGARRKKRWKWRSANPLYTRRSLEIRPRALHPSVARRRKLSVMAINAQNAYLLAMMLTAVCFGLPCLPHLAFPVLIIFFFYGNRNTGIFAVLYCVVVYTMLHSHNPSQSLKSPAMIIVSMMLLISTIVSSNKY